MSSRVGVALSESAAVFSAFRNATSSVGGTGCQKGRPVFTTCETRSTAHAVAAFVLGLVELVVGAADQVHRGDILLADRGRDAARDGHVVELVLELERRLADDGDDAFGEDQGAFDVRFGQDDGELLAAVAGEQLLLADAPLDAGGKLAEGEVAAEVAEVVVDVLELVDVDHDQREGALITGAASELAVEEFEEVALVEGLGQGIHDGEAVDFLVVFRLDVAAGQEAIDAVAHAEVVAVLELVHGGGDVVDVGAVGRLEIDGVVAVGAGLDAGVATAYRVVVDADLAVAGTAEDDRLVGESVARAHAGAGGIDVD